MKRRSCAGRPGSSTAALILAGICSAEIGGASLMLAESSARAARNDAIKMMAIAKTAIFEEVLFIMFPK